MTPRERVVGLPTLRLSPWLWHVPGSVFLVATVVGTLVIDRGSIPLWAVLASLVLVAAATAAVRVATTTAPGWAVAAPTSLLASAGVLHGAAHGELESLILLGGLPVAWLAFDFGRRGALVAGVGLVVVAATPYLTGVQVPGTALGRWDDLLPPAGLAGMAVVTHQAGRLLRAAEAAMLDRTRMLEREVAITSTIVDSVDISLAIFIDGRLTLLNQRAIEVGRQLGAPELRSTGGVLPEGIGVYDADGRTPTADVDRAFRRAERGEEFDGLVQWIGSPGDLRAMVASSSLIKDHDGRVLGTLFAAWEATEVIESVRVREEFLGTVTHELRTPLTAISGYLDLHEEYELHDVLSGDDRTYLDGVRRNLHALGDRIEDLIGAATPHAPRREVVDVAARVREVVTAHQERARAAGLHLTVSTPATLPAAVDASAFAVVVDHLLSNALTYTDDGSVRVAVEALATPALPGATPLPCGVVVTVTDTGIGMNDREADRAFDRFYRAEGAVRRVLPGLGMGLAVAKQIVQAHQGTITVQSVPGRGSTFRVTFPEGTAEVA